MKILIILLSVLFISCEEAAKSLDASINQPNPEFKTTPNDNIENETKASYSVIRDESDRFEGVFMSSNIKEGKLYLAGEETRDRNYFLQISFKQNSEIQLTTWYVTSNDENVYYTRNIGNFKAELIDHNGEEKLLMTIIISESTVKNAHYNNYYSGVLDEITYYDTYTLGVDRFRNHLTSDVNEVKFIYNEQDQRVEKFEDDLPGNLIGTEFNQVI